MKTETVFYSGNSGRAYAAQRIMKTAIVFYSMGGNTAFAAQRIARELHADLIEIKPEKQYPDKGFRKFLWGGKSAVMAETPALLPYDFQPEKYGQIILGFPVWAGNIAPPLRTFVRDNLAGLKDKRTAAFACQSGAGAEKAFGKLEAALGGRALAAKLILIDPKDKPNPENDEIIKAFCDSLKNDE